MRALRAMLFAGYPILVFAALQHLSPRIVALVALAVGSLRLLVSPRERWLGYARAGAWPMLAVGAVVVVTAVFDDPRALLLAPALASFALLLTFGRSLLEHESVVEAIARVQLGSLTEAESRYCRRVTGLWCAFFVANGSIALYLALWGTMRAWALYTGLLAYVAVGILFAAEYSYRQWRFRRYLGAPSDAFFRRLFPPRGE